MYKDLRKERVEIFEETKRLYHTNQRLAASIIFPRQNQKVIAEGVPISVPADSYPVPAGGKNRPAALYNRQYKSRERIFMKLNKI